MGINEKICFSHFTKQLMMIQPSTIHVSIYKQDMAVQPIYMPTRVYKLAVTLQNRILDS